MRQRLDFTARFIHSSSTSIARVSRHSPPSSRDIPATAVMSSLATTFALAVLSLATASASEQPRRPSFPSVASRRASLSARLAARSVQPSRAALIAVCRARFADAHSSRRLRSRRRRKQCHWSRSSCRCRECCVNGPSANRDPGHSGFQRRRNQSRSKQRWYPSSAPLDARTPLQYSRILHAYALHIHCVAAISVSNSLFAIKNWPARC